MKRVERQLGLVDRLAALGDETRLRALRVLEVQELSVGELAKVLQLPQSTASRHLKVLADGNWVVRRAEGTASLFRVLHDELEPDSRILWTTIRDQMSLADWAGDEHRLRAVLSERRTDSQAFFGKVAGAWDEVRSELFGTSFTSIALLSLIRRDWTVADIGCGTGNAAELLAPVVSKVLAIDQSAPMLDAARQRLAGLSNIDFIESRADATGLDTASIDATVAFLVLHHLEHPAAAIREFRRILRATRAGGVALIIDMVEHDREDYRRTMGHLHLGFSRRTICQMCAEAGFASADYRELPAAAEARGPGLFACIARVKKDEF